MATQSPRTSANDETIEETNRFTPRFDTNGLIPAIVMDTRTRDVAMFAWMNQLSLDETRRTGLAHFWSRSRKKLWCKGEESGNCLRVQRIRTDCDQDCLIIDVTIEGDGVACHTKRTSCFYRQLDEDGEGTTPRLSLLEH